MVARRKSDTPVKVFKYGLLAPTSGAAALDEQLWLASRYYNNLIEVERARREAYKLAAGRLTGDDLKKFARGLDEERKDVCNARTRDPDWGPGLRGTCGLYSGTYLRVEQSVDLARRSKAPPRFRRFDGSGYVAVQCGGGGVPVADALTGHRLLHVDTSPVVRVTKRHPDGRVVRNGAVLRIPVTPRPAVWAEFPMVLHRPLPSDGMIKWVVVTKRREGTRWRWDVTLTIEAASLAMSAGANTAVGIDLNWSRGRVAHWSGSDGAEGFVDVPGAVFRKLRYADSVRSTRDQYLRVAKHVACSIDATCNNPKLSAKGLARRVRGWMADGVDVGVLRHWLARDRHLYQIESGVRVKAKRRLLNDYRVVAAQLAQRYGTIFVENLDLSALAVDGIGGSSRHDYSPSTLRDALKNAGRVVLVDAAWTSRDCHCCGSRVEWGDSYHEPVCGGCGWSGDRDVNASRNVLARGLAMTDRAVALESLKLRWVAERDRRLGDMREAAE